MAKRKDNRIAASVIDSSTQTLEKTKRETDTFDHVKYLGVAAQVAESAIYCGNWKIKNSEKHYPTSPLMRTVDRYFPQAKGGPLFVDQPQTQRDIASCEAKVKVMKQEGLRYVYITPEMTADEAVKQMKDNGF